LVHLLRELACELDRLDVRAEGAAEDAFEDTLQPLLDSAQHHYDAAEGTPRAGARSAVTAAIAQAASSRGRAAALGTAATVSTPSATMSMRSGAERTRVTTRGRRPSAATGASSGPRTNSRAARGSRQVTSSQPAASAA